MTAKDYLFRYIEDGWQAIDNACDFVSDVQFYAKKERLGIDKKDIRVFSQFRWGAMRMKQICDRINNDFYKKGEKK